MTTIREIAAQAPRMRILITQAVHRVSLTWRVGPDKTPVAWIGLTMEELAELLDGNCDQPELWLRGVAFVGARTPSELRAALEACIAAVPA